MYRKWLLNGMTKMPCIPERHTVNEPGKLHLSLARWRTPEAIDLVGVSDGDVIMRLRGVATNWNSSWGNNYIHFQ